MDNFQIQGILDQDLQGEEIKDLVVRKDILRMKIVNGMIAKERDLVHHFKHFSLLYSCKSRLFIHEFKIFILLCFSLLQSIFEQNSVFENSISPVLKATFPK